MSDIPADSTLPPIVVEEPGPETQPLESIDTKPRRGRPPGAKNKVREESSTPQPIKIEADQERKRGRPVGGKKTVDKSALAKQLLFAHAVAAQITRIPDLAIDSGEADILAGAITNLMVEYDIALSGKTAALMGMVGALAIVYGPRAVLISNKIKEAKARQAASNPAPLPVDHG